MGSTFAVFLLSWLVFDLTGSKIAMGSVWVAFMIPNLGMNIIMGPYLDRWDRRNVMIFSELLRGGTFFILTLVYTFDALMMWQLYFVAILLGIAEPLFRPSSMAYVAQILPKDRLQKGNSLLDGTVQTVMLFGPALGGLMISTIGTFSVMVTLVSVLCLSGILLFFLPRKKKAVVEKKQGWLGQFKEGLKFYQMYPVLLWVGIMMMMINFASGAAQPMYLPFVIEELNGNAFHYGLFTSAFSTGMIMGSLFTAVTKEPNNRRAVMLGALMINGSLLALLGWVNVFEVAALMVFASGFTAIIFNINNTTLYQKRVPDEIRGRVFTVRIFLAQAGIPFGAGFGGLVADMTSITGLFTILGSIVVMITIVAWFSPVFRLLNEPLEKGDLDHHSTREHAI